MKRMPILAVILLLVTSGTARAQMSSPVGTESTPQVSAQTGAQVNSPTNAASTVTGAVGPSAPGVAGVTGGSFGSGAPVAIPCPFGTSLSANLTAFGCASDPLGAPTYQIPSEAGAAIAVTTGSVAGAGVNVQTATSGASGTGVASSSSRCLNAIPSTASSTGLSDIFGGGVGC